MPVGDAIGVSLVTDANTVDGGDGLDGRTAAPRASSDAFSSIPLVVAFWSCGVNRFTGDTLRGCISP